MIILFSHFLTCVSHFLMCPCMLLPVHSHQERKKKVLHSSSLLRPPTQDVPGMYGRWTKTRPEQEEEEGDALGRRQQTRREQEEVGRRHNSISRRWPAHALLLSQCPPRHLPHQAQSGEDDAGKLCLVRANQDMGQRRKEGWRRGASTSFAHGTWSGLQTVGDAHFIILFFFSCLRQTRPPFLQAK